MYIGIDLGGTNIAAAIVDSDGVIIDRVSIPTDIKGGASSINDGLLTVCGKLTGNKPVSPTHIGIGVPGIVDNNKGEVIFAPNLSLSGANIVNGLQKKYDCPIYLGNDANCAALGEAAAGGAKGALSAVFVTLGTGVGGGIILNGQLYTGVNGMAGEIGHIVIVEGGRECGCGRRGCWERYASATGLIETAIGFMNAHAESRLWEFCGRQPDKLSGRMVFDAYREGDHAAVSAIGSYVTHLASGTASIINILQPEVICFGGGISDAWDCLAGPLLAEVDVQKYTRSSSGITQTRIVKAELGNDAGIIGAAMLGALDRS